MSVTVHQPQVFPIALLSKDPFTLTESESGQEYFVYGMEFDKTRWSYLWNSN